MTWNIRVIKTTEDNVSYLQVAEVYYNEHGKPCGWTPADATAQTIDELHTYVDWMKEALAYPVVEFGKCDPECCSDTTDCSCK